MDKFKNVGIGIFDINNVEIKEGDEIKYKDRLYGNREFKGKVIYNNILAQFLIERGKHGEDGGATFSPDRANSIEILNRPLSNEEKENEFANLININANRINIIIKEYKTLTKLLKTMPDKDLSDRVDIIKVQCQIDGICKVLTTLGINIETL